MNRSRTFKRLVIVLFVAACNPPGAAPDYAAQLRQADIDFAAETVARGNDGWAEYFMPDGIMFPRSGMVQGREEIRTAMAEAFLPGTRLDWEPEQAIAAQSGDLGYTIGRWQSIVVTADGRDSVTAEGNYVSIWRRDADGQWRVAADIGNTDQPANGGSD